MDKLNAMKAFVKIVEQGSLSKAAEKLNTSSPTVVRQLAALEESLSVRLLNRTTRRISLTQEGQQYLQHCQRILSDIEASELALLSQHNEPRGTVRVSAPLLFGQKHVSPAVIHYLERYEHARVELLLEDKVVNMLEDGIDVAIRIGHLPDSSLVATHVGYIRQVVCVSPEYLAKTRKPNKPQDLVNLKCINFSTTGLDSAWLFQIDDKEISAPVSTAFSCNHGATALDACIKGLGYGQFLSYQVKSLIKSKRLVSVLHDFEIPPIPVSIIYPHARLLSTSVRAFVDTMKEHLSRELT